MPRICGTLKNVLTRDVTSVIIPLQFGGVAQLARAFGSYPTGRWFKSDFRYHTRPVGQEVKTPPFHGSNMGSIPVRVTKRNKSELFRKSKLVRICFLLLITQINVMPRISVCLSSALFFTNL